MYNVSDSPSLNVVSLQGNLNDLTLVIIRMYLACKLGSNTKVLVKSFADWTGIDKLSNSTSFIDILLDESSLIIWLP